jgi:predicted Zn-dependent protease
LATAERYALLGRIGDAAIHAKRAAGALPQGSPGWRRADDILKASRDAT